MLYAPLDISAICPASFHAHPDNGLCYGVVDLQFNFFTAEKYCRNLGEGGMLAKINDMSLMNWLKEKMLDAL